MEQQCRQIIADLYEDKRVNEYLNKLQPADLRDELKQFAFAAVCELAENNPERLKQINEKDGALFGFIQKIIWRQLTGKNSKFRKDFRNESIVDIDGRQDVELQAQDGLIDHSQELREEILNRWLTGESIYDEGLASIQKVYATGRGIKAELKHLENVQRGLFQDGYVMFALPFLVMIDQSGQGSQNRLVTVHEKISWLKNQPQTEDNIELLSEYQSELEQLKKQTTEKTQKMMEKVTGAGEFLSSFMQRFVGRELGRENDAFIVRIGEAVVIESKI